MKVYCCFSLYNLYIAVAKAMVQNEKIDLVIGSQMPDYKNKIETIKSLDFINEIYVFDSVDYKNIKYKNTFDKIVNRKNYENKYINTKLKIDWTKYLLRAAGADFHSCGLRHRRAGQDHLSCAQRK